MKKQYKGFLLWAVVALLFTATHASAASELKRDIARDYDEHLEGLFKYFHQNPELSFLEQKTAQRLGDELRTLGFKVVEGIGKTGVVALLENGPGPLVMVRGDMDGLPVEEKSGLKYASKAKQIDPIKGVEVAVMHACGHDVHVTSLVGTAKQMAKRKDEWAGTLMLIGQPAEERGLGAKAMVKARIWRRFGKPDYALAFHVSAGLEAGKINVVHSPFAGVDSVNITVHGVGAHGASPHAGKDPIVLASQIVLALQTLVSRELAPREPGVVTVGSFHSGTKHNIISERADLQLTVRNASLETRQKLLSGIERIAKNIGRAAGLPENKLPEVEITDEDVPPTLNDMPLVKRLRTSWQAGLGADNVLAIEPLHMGGEDFPFFTMKPYVPSVYFTVGGTPKKALREAARGGKPVPSHHSPYFKIEPESSVTLGVEATVLALFELMGK